MKIVPLRWMRGTALALIGLAGASVIWPGSPIRRLVGDSLEGWVVAGKLDAHWTDLSSIRERRGRQVIGIVEFVDYGCLYCQRAEEVLDAFQDRWKTVGIGVRIVSPNVLARRDRRAILAVCADRLGHFPLIHELFFRDRSTLGLRDLEDLSSALGTDVQELDACFNDNQIHEWLEADIRWAEILGIRGTPTFVGRKEIYQGIPSLEVLERLAGLKESPEQPL